MTPPAIDQWLRVIEDGRTDLLDDLLTQDAVFYSPAVFTPQEGHAKVTAYLRAAERMFDGSGFHYVEQWFNPKSAVLQFSAEVDGVHVEGTDIIHWDDQDKITSFKVTVRPFKALQTLIAKMGALLPATDGPRPT